MAREGPRILTGPKRVLPKREYQSALVFFGSFVFVFGYGPQLTDWIRSERKGSP